MSASLWTPYSAADGVALDAQSLLSSPRCAGGADRSLGGYRDRAGSGRGWSLGECARSRPEPCGCRGCRVAVCAREGHPAKSDGRIERNAVDPRIGHAGDRPLGQDGRVFAVSCPLLEKVVILIILDERARSSSGYAPSTITARFGIMAKKGYARASRMVLVLGIAHLLAAWSAMVRELIRLEFGVRLSETLVGPVAAAGLQAATATAPGLRAGSDAGQAAHRPSIGADTG